MAEQIFEEEVTPMPEQVIQGEPEPKPKSNASGLYQSLLKSGKYTKANLGSEDDFAKALQSRETADKIYDNLIKTGFTQANLGGDKNNFYKSMFIETTPAPVEKKNQVGPSAPLESKLQSVEKGTSDGFLAQNDIVKTKSGDLVKIRNKQKEYSQVEDVKSGKVYDIKNSDFDLTPHYRKEVVDQAEDNPTLSLINQSFEKDREIHNAKVSNNLAQAENLEAQKKQLDSQIEQDYGITPSMHETLRKDINEVKPFLIPDSEQGLSKQSLIDQYKSDPLQYEKNVAYLKLLKDWQLVGQKANIPFDYSVISLTDSPASIEKAADQIRKFGGDYRDKMLDNLSKYSADIYGASLLNNPSIFQGQPEKQFLNDNQLVAYNFLKTIRPEEAAAYDKLFVDPKLLQNNPTAKAGWEEAGSALEQMGLGMQLTAAKKQYAATGDEDTAAAINNIQSQLDNLKVKYKMPAEVEAQKAARQITGNETMNWYTYPIAKIGDEVSNTLSGLANFIAEPFRSDEASKVNQLEIGGQSMWNELNIGQPAESIQYKTQKLKVSPELQGLINPVLADKTISQDEKTRKIYDLLKEHPTDYGFVPIKNGQVDITPYTMYYSLVNLGATLLPYIAIESVTGGGATAGVARKIASSFMAAGVTQLQANLTSAIRENKPNPFGYALIVTGITSAAMALAAVQGAATPEMVKKILGTNTAIGEMVNRLADKDIAEIMKSPAFKEKVQRLTAAIAKSGEEAFKGGIKFELTAGLLPKVAIAKINKEDLNPEQLVTEGALGVLNFTAFGIFGIAGQYKKLDELTASSLYHASLNPNAFLAAAKRRLDAKTLSQEDYNQIVDNIKLAATVAPTVNYTKLNGKELSEKKKGQLLALKMQEAKLAEEKESLPEEYQEKVEKEEAEVKKEIKIKIGEPEQISQPIELSIEPIKKTEKEKPTTEKIKNIIKDAVNKFLSKAGLPELDHSNIKIINRDLSREIADAYENMAHDPKNPEVKAAYDALMKETKPQFEELVKAGIKFELWNGKGEPYKNSKEMLKDLQENKHLFILPNEEAFGEGADKETFKDNVGLQQSGYTDINGRPMTNSEMFRGVHDAIAHGIYDNGFNEVGEENAALIHAKLYSKEAQKALFAQTRGQNSWVNFNKDMYDENGVYRGDRYLDNGELNPNFVPRSKRPFAEPKIGILPEEFNFTEYESKQPERKPEITGKGKETPVGGGKVQELTTGKKEPTGKNAPSLSGRYTNPDGSPQYVIRTGDQGGRRTGLDVVVNGVKTKARAIYKQSSAIKELVNRYKNAYTDDYLIELDDPVLFEKLISESKKNNEHGAAVYVYTPEEYAKMRLFITPDGNAGVALKDNGDLVSGFSNKELDRPRRIAQLILLGIKEGALKADSFDTVLPQYYLDFGLIPVAQDSWKEEFKPEGWDKKVFALWGKVPGEPDVIYYVYGGGDRGTIQNRINNFGRWEDIKNEIPYAEYDKAVEIQNEKIAEVEELSKKVVERKNLADKIRLLKTKPGNTFLLLDMGLSKMLYDKALDIIANQVEKGTKFGQAIENAVKYIDEQLKGKSWNKELFFRNSIAVVTESSVKPGEKQNAMVITGDKDNKPIVKFSGETSQEELRTHSPKTYVNRAADLSKTHLYQGKPKRFNDGWSKEKQLEWADNIYKEIKETVKKNLLAIYNRIPKEVREISKLWYDGANKIAQEFAKQYNLTLEQSSAVIATLSPQKPWFDNLHLAQFMMDFHLNKQDKVFNMEAYEYYKLTGQDYPKQVAYLPELEKSIGKKYSELSDYDKSVMIRYEFDNFYDRKAPLRLPTGHIIGQVDSKSSFSGYDKIANAVSILNDGSKENISNNIGSDSKVRNFYNNIVDPTSADHATIDTHAIAAGYMLPIGSKDFRVKFDFGTYSVFFEAYKEAAKEVGILPREMQSIVWEGVKSLFPDDIKQEKLKNEVLDLWDKYKNKEISIEEVQNQIFEKYGKDVSITDWSGFIDNRIAKGEIGGFIGELPRVSGDTEITGKRGGRGIKSEVPTMGETDRGDGAKQAKKSSIKEKSKKIAANVRKAKIDLSKLSGGGLQSNIAGLPLSVYNAVIETAALAIEGGATLYQAIKKAYADHKLDQYKEYNESELIKSFEKITGEKYKEEVIEPTKVGVHHAALTDIAKKIGLPEPQRGEHYTPEEYANRGRLFMEHGFGVDEVDNKINDLDDRISIGRAFYEKYINELNQIRKTQGEKSQAYIDKKQQVADLQEKIKKLGTKASDAMKSLQGTRDIDTDNFEVVRQNVESIQDKPLTKDQENKIKNLTDTNEKLKSKLEIAEKALIDATNKVLETKAGAEPKTKEAAKKSYSEMARSVADRIRKAAKIHKPGIFSAATPASLIWDSAVEIVAKTIEAGGSISDAISKGLNHIKESSWYKGLSDDNKKQAEKEFTDFHEENASPLDGTIESLWKRFQNRYDNDFSKEESKAIWDYAKTNYLDKNVSYIDMIYKVADDLGLNSNQVRAAITLKYDKYLKSKSDEVWKARSDYRKNQNATRRWIESQNPESPLWEGIKKVSGLLRGEVVFGHGAIFVGTHSGATLFDLQKSPYTLKAFLNGYKFAYGNKAKYEMSMEDLKHKPNYLMAQRAGLRNNPDIINQEEYQNSQKFLGKIATAGERGFNAIKVLRQELFDWEWNRLTDEERKDPNTAKQVAWLINNATGATNLPLPEWVNEVTFAGGMEAARWGKLTRNPVKASENAIKWLTGKATPAEKAFAKVWARRVGSQLGTYGSLLIVNAAIQSLIDDKKKVNLTDPNKPDFMKFKFGDIMIDPTSGMLGAANFIYNLGRFPFQEKKELKGEQPLIAAGKGGAKYLRGKLAPFYSTVLDFYTKHDFRGNPLFTTKEKPTIGHHKVSWQEYLTQKLPLPLAEAAGEMYNSALNNGENKVGVHHAIDGIISGGLSGATGFRVKTMEEEVPKAEYSKEELKEFEFLKDKGVTIPDVNRRETYKVKTDLDHPDGIMTIDEYGEFIKRVKEISISELKKFPTNEFWVINKKTGNYQTVKGQELIDNPSYVEQLQSEINSIHDDAVKQAKKELNLIPTPKEIKTIKIPNQ